MQLKPGGKIIRGVWENGEMVKKLPTRLKTKADKEKIGKEMFEKATGKRSIKDIKTEESSSESSIEEETKSH